MDSEFLKKYREAKKDEKLGEPASEETMDQILSLVVPKFIVLTPKDALTYLNVVEMISRPTNTDPYLDEIFELKDAKKIDSKSLKVSVQLVEKYSYHVKMSHKGKKGEWIHDDILQAKLDSGECSYDDYKYPTLTHLFNSSKNQRREN